MKMKILLIITATLFATIVLTITSFAKIDPKTCVGLWLLDEGKGDTAKDLSGNNYDGTIKNSPKWIDGKFGKALDFTGVNDHISIPKGSALLEQQFSQMTMVAWVNPVSFGGGTYGHTIISRTDNDGWAMRVNNGQLLADLRLTGGNVTKAVSADKLPLNAWSHIAITYDNSNGVITGYINGKNIGTLKSSGTIKNGANANTCTFIGTDPAGCTPQGAEFDFNGSIDEVAMFSVALTENDIKAIFNNGLSAAMGMSAVSPSEKLATKWAEIKTR